jgi:hypothetical protein
VGCLLASSPREVRAPKAARAHHQLYQIPRAKDVACYFPIAASPPDPKPLPGLASRPPRPLPIATSNSTLDTSPLYRDFEGCQDFELQELDRRTESTAEKGARETERDRKRREKLEQLREADEMKFSHSLQFNAVPDWSNHYIAYSNLKKQYV